MTVNAAKSTNGASASGPDATDASMEDILRSIRDILGDDPPATAPEPRFPEPGQTANHSDNERAAMPERPKRAPPLAFLQRRREKREQTQEDRPTLEERLARHRQKAEAEREALRRLVTQAEGDAAERRDDATDDVAMENELARALTDDLDDALFRPEGAEPTRPKLPLPDLEPEVIDYSGTARPVGATFDDRQGEPYDPEVPEPETETETERQAEPVPSAFVVPEPAAAAAVANEPAPDPLESAIEELAAPLQSEPALRGTLDGTNGTPSGAVAEQTVEVIAGPTVDREPADELRALMSEHPAALKGALMDLMRPIVADWLDDNLPHIVEKVVRDEIEQVSRGRR